MRKHIGDDISASVSALHTTGWNHARIHKSYPMVLDLCPNFRHFSDFWYQYCYTFTVRVRMCSEAYVECLTSCLISLLPYSCRCLEDEFAEFVLQYHTILYVPRVYVSNCYQSIIPNLILTYFDSQTWCSCVFQTWNLKSDPLELK